MGDCKHKFKAYATINYVIPVELYDDGCYGWFFQDKIYECENCYTQKVVTRACKVESALQNKMSITIEGKFARVPLWYNMVDGKFVDSKFGEIHEILNNRELDNPEFPVINLAELLLNGKTIIYEKVLSE